MLSKFSWFACLMLTGALLLAAGVAGPLTAAGDKKEKKKEDEPEVRKGKVIGVLVAKEVKKGVFIEVKADGEEKARKYMPQWVGGAPAAGGGFDKKMVKTIESLKIGSRLELDWVFQERFRAVGVKVLEEPKEK